MIRRVRTLVLGALFALAAVYVATKDDPAEKAPELTLELIARRELGDGIELVEASLRRAEAYAGRVVVLYLEPRSVIPEIVINREGRPISELAPEALIVVNAGFFTPERRPTGLLAAEGRIFSSFVAEGGPAGSGVFVLEGAGPELLARDKVGTRNFARAALAIQAGPRIIEPDGAPGIRSDDGARANRTVLGADARGRIAVAIVAGPAGSASGPTLFETQQILGQDGLGRLDEAHPLHFALNLDGGTSTGLIVRDPQAPVRVGESVTVHSLLAFRRRP